MCVWIGNVPEKKSLQIKASVNSALTFKAKHDLNCSSCVSFDDKLQSTHAVLCTLGMHFGQHHHTVSEK